MTSKIWSNALQMCHTFYFEKDTAKPLPMRLVFDLLTHDAMTISNAAHSAGYYWSRLGSAFVEQYPTQKWDFFSAVLRSAAKSWSVLLDLNTNKEHLLTELLKENPERAFKCITEILREGDRQMRGGLQQWLADDGHRMLGSESHGPVIHIPTKMLFDWVDENVEVHGSWLARALPKTLNRTVGGRMTRDFIARYGRDDSISAALYSRFHSRSWCGNASDLYQKLSTEAREWLVEEKNANVVHWVEEYIDGLNWDIERAKLDEERRH